MSSGYGTDEKLKQLSRWFSAGRYPDMERLSQEILEMWPDEARAWKALGMAQLVQGKPALPALQRALSLVPNDVEVMAALGSAQAAAGDLVGAASLYEAALTLQPNQPHLYANLADLMLRLGQPWKAESLARRGVHLRPDLLAAWLNLGRALLEQARSGDAVACFERCLQLQVSHRLATSLLSRSLRESGRPTDALKLLQQAVLNDPEAVDLRFQLGLLLRSVGSLEEAAREFRRVMALSPSHAQALTNLAVCQLEMGDAAAALTGLQKAAEWQPNDALIHANLGNAYMASGRFVAAVCAHREAVARAPDDTRLRRNLAHVLRTVGDASGALAELRLAMQAEPHNLSLRSEALFVGQYLAQDQPAQQAVCAEARHFAAAVARNMPVSAFQHWVNIAQPDRPLRVGLVSADLRAHPIAYFLEPLLRAWSEDPESPIHVWAYANQRSGDGTTDRLRALCKGWRYVADEGDQALSEVIRADGIDVLLDVSGHTLGNRLPLFAFRPAPVQVAWLGFSTTTGLDCFDAVLADPHLAPPGDQEAFVEPVLRLPETAFCMTWPTSSLDCPDAYADNAYRLSDRMPTEGTRFGCFNHLAKMGPAVIQTWSRILQGVPGSSLRLLAAPFQDPEVVDHVSAAFAACGVEPTQLRLLPSTSREAYLRAYGDVDIALDPFPYPGGATTLEALWMGVPVLTMNGATPLSRQGVSFLMNLGLSDWVARDQDDYVARAIRFSANPEFVANLKHELRSRMARSPLCDGRLMARRVNEALRQLWRRWCAGGKADLDPSQE